VPAERKRGSVRLVDGEWIGRVYTRSGKKPVVRLGKGSETMARERLGALQARMTAEGIEIVDRRYTRAVAPSERGPGLGGLLASTATVSAWSEVWLAERERKGIVSAPDDRARLRDHILPVIGTLPMASVSRADVERVVRALDEKVLAGALAWKTAQNVWGILSRMSRDAAGSKNPALRVRSDNPAQGVESPDRGNALAKSYLYPNELVALLSCDAVPAKFRLLYAVAAYTYARTNELAALAMEDVDLRHGVVLIHRAVNRKSKGREEKSTKGMASRRIPLEPSVAPLLAAVVAARGKGRLFDLPISKLAQSVRKHLLLAGVTRADLHTSDATRKPLGFHDLRATGITWMALRGDDPLKIQQRAGHRQFSTTQVYLREAETLGVDTGTPFPALPVAFVDAAQRELGLAISQTMPRTIPGPSGDSTMLDDSTKDGAGHGIRTRIGGIAEPYSAASEAADGSIADAKCPDAGAKSESIVRNRAARGRGRVMLRGLRDDVAEALARLERNTDAGQQGSAS